MAELTVDRRGPRVEVGIRSEKHVVILDLSLRAARTLLAQLECANNRPNWEGTGMVLGDETLKVEAKGKST